MNKIVEHYYEVKSKKLNDTRIVLLSDIHYYNKEDVYKLKAIYERVVKLKPNYIAIAGDLLDEAFVSDLDEFYNWIHNLSKCADVLISIGNHDLYVKDSSQRNRDHTFFNTLARIPHVKVLDNTSYKTDNICFKGLTLPVSYYLDLKESKDEFIKEVNQVFPKTDDKKFNILLCHTPLAIARKEVLEQIGIAKQLDLILCGHTHGGITPEFLKTFLKPRGLISPLRKLFFKNAYGHIIHDETNIIISSGVTKASHRNKFRKLDPFFAREITIIDVKS